MNVETKPPAPLASRLAAMAYDWLLLAALLFVVTLILILARGGAALAPGTGWYTTLLIGVSFAFYGWFWTHGGQTLGLRAWRLRVERSDGHPLGWIDAARRFGASAVLFVPPAVGLLWILVDPRRSAWHDRLSRTRIVQTSAPTREAPGQRQA